MATKYIFIIIVYILSNIIAEDDTSCDQVTESHHNEFIKEEFARQSYTFYEAAKIHKTDNLTPLIDAANIKSTDIILDLACGPGLITTECAKKNPQKVYGMDITKEMLDIAKKHASDHGVENKIQFIQGNVENLPFDDNTFDIVITRWTFHHFDKLNKVINEIYRILKPETGKLVFLEFCAPNITYTDTEVGIIDVFNAIHTIRDPSHVWAFNENDWIKQVNDGGFVMENIEIIKRLSLEMNLMQFIERTNPSEADKRARKSIHVIGEFLTDCNCDVGMNFHYNDNKELMFTIKYIIVVATKS